MRAVATTDDSGLNERQRLFVREYLVDLNGTQAAIRAGYSPKRAAEIAYENLRKPQIEAAIAEAHKAREKRVELDADWVLSRLKLNVERAMQETQATNREGEPVGDFEYDGAVANKALELLGKHLALFVDKVQTEHSGEVRVVRVPKRVESSEDWESSKV